MTIELAGLTNLRDVGGTVIDGARRVRRELVYRSDAPYCSRPFDRLELQTLRLATMIDLRTAAESLERPTSAPPGVRVVTAEILERGDNEDAPLLQELLSGRLPRFTGDDLVQRYLLILERSPKAFGAALSALARPANLPALVHCAGGKDRTGLVVALLLDVLGVPRVEIAADYAISAERRAFRRQELEPILAAHSIPIADVEGLLGAPPGVVVAALKHLDTNYGSTRTYLIEAAGMTSADLDEIEALLVERISPGQGDPV